MNTAQTAVYQHLTGLGAYDGEAKLIVADIPDHLSAEFTSIDAYILEKTAKVRTALDREIDAADSEVNDLERKLCAAEKKLGKLIEKKEEMQNGGQTHPSTT